MRDIKLQNERLKRKKKISSPLELGFWVLIGVLYISPLFLPITSLQEARRAELVQEAVKLGHWLIPSLNGEPYVTKPPLHTWLAAALAKLGGLSAPILRLPSGLSALGVAWLIFRLAQRAGGKETALWALIFLLAAPKFFFFAHRVDLEMLLAFFFTLYLFEAWQYLEKGKSIALWGAFAALGLGFLTKGPFILLAWLSIMAYGLSQKEKRALKLALHPGGWLLALAPTLIWYFYAYTQVGEGGFQEFLLEDLRGRLAGKEADPFYKYAGALFLGFLPESLLLLYRPQAFWSHYWAKPLNRFLFWAWMAPLLALSLTSDKFSKYLLSLYPFWAYFLAERTRLCLGPRIKGLRPYAVLLVVFMVAGALSLEIKSGETRLKSLKVVEPYLKGGGEHYFWKKAHPLLVFYHGQPLPVLKEKIPPKALIWEAASGCQSELKDKGYWLVKIVRSFYRPGQCLYLYSSGEASSRGSSGSGK